MLEPHFQLEEMMIATIWRLVQNLAVVEMLMDIIVLFATATNVDKLAITQSHLLRVNCYIHSSEYLKILEIIALSGYINNTLIIYFDNYLDAFCKEYCFISIETHSLYNIFICIIRKLWNENNKLPLFWCEFK